MNRKIKPTYVSRRRSAGYSYGRNKNIAAYQSAIKLGPITSTLMIGLMVTVLGLIYLTQATRVTSYDYQLSQVDAQIAELSSKKANLEIEQARLTSIQTLINSTVAQNMTPASDVSYVRN